MSKYEDTIIRVCLNSQSIYVEDDDVMRYLHRTPELQFNLFPEEALKLIQEIKDELKKIETRVVNCSKPSENLNHFFKIGDIRSDLEDD